MASPGFVEKRAAKRHGYNLRRIRKLTQNAATLCYKRIRCFLQAGCPSCRPTNSVKALKATPMSIKTQRTGFVTSKLCWLASRSAKSEPRWRQDCAADSPGGVIDSAPSREVAAPAPDRCSSLPLSPYPTTPRPSTKHPPNPFTTVHTRNRCNTHTHMSRYQKGKTNLDFTVARD